MQSGQLFIVVILLKYRFVVSLNYKITVDVIHFKERSIAKVVISEIKVKINYLNLTNVHL